MANLLASLIVALVMGVTVHWALTNMEPPEPPRATDDEAPPAVSVRYAGIEPREPLRLRVGEGHKEDVRFTLWVNTAVDSAARQQRGVPAALSHAEGLNGLDLAAIDRGLGLETAERTATFVVRMKVTEADADTVTIDWRVRSTSAGERPDEEWADAVKRAKKMRGTSVIARSGRPIESTMEGDSYRSVALADVSTLLRRWMAEPATLFPEEPVGHGAIWEVERELTDAGVRTLQRARVEVTDVKASGVTLTEAHTAELLGSDLEFPGAPNLIDMYARDLRLRGDAAFVADLDRIAGIGDGRVSTKVDLIMGLGVAEMVTHSSSEVELVVDRP